MSNSYPDSDGPIGQAIPISSFVTLNVPYYITSRFPPYGVITVPNNSTTQGVQLASMPIATPANTFQQWKFVTQNNSPTADTCELINVGSGYCMNVSGGGGGDGIAIIQWDGSGWSSNETWGLAPYGANQYFAFVCTGSRKCVTVYQANPTSQLLAQNPTSGNPNATWTFQRVNP